MVRPAGMRMIQAVALTAILVSGCVTASTPWPSGPRPSSGSPLAARPDTTDRPAASGSPEAFIASIDAAQARWNAQKPQTYAYTYTHLGPSGVGWDFHYRVTSLDGQVQVQSLDDFPRLSGSQPQGISVDDMFDQLRKQADTWRSFGLRFDPIYGYPAEVSHDDSGATDSDWTDTVTDFTTEAAWRPDKTRHVVAAARAAWKDREPSAYAYVWRRFQPLGGPDSGTAWDIVQSDGHIITQPDPASDGVLPAESASIIGTFDAIDAALDAGAWVDVTVAPVTGVPLLVAVDPSSAVVGDEFWIRITFQDTEKEVVQAALDAARTRWAAAGLQHYSYVWRYRGTYDPLTYWMTLNGEVATIRRAPGTPITEATAFGVPRIDDTLQLIGQALAQGGRVDATYDPILGYPIRVKFDPIGDAGPPGTITISDFAIR